MQLMTSKSSLHSSSCCWITSVNHAETVSALLIFSSYCMCRSSFWWSSKAQNSWPTFYHCAFPNIAKNYDWYQTESRGVCYIVTVCTHWIATHVLIRNLFFRTSETGVMSWKEEVWLYSNPGGWASVHTVIRASLYNFDYFKETRDQAVGTDSGYDGVKMRLATTLIWSDLTDYSTRCISFVFK